MRTRAATRPRADRSELNRNLAQTHGSYELVVSPLILGLLGWWLDGRFGTRPLLVVVFAVFGVAGAATKLFLDYRRKMAEHVGEAEAANTERLAQHAAARAERDAARAELEAQLAEAERAASTGVSA